MGDYGAAVSQKGYDVKTCADRFLVYSSVWPVLKIFNVYTVSGTVPDGGSDDFTVNASTNVFTSNGHGLSDGFMVNFTTSDTLPSPLIEWPDEYYYVIESDTNTFKVSLELDGDEVDLTDTGTGTHTWYNDEMFVDVYHNLGYLSPFMISFNGVTGDLTKSYMDSPGAIESIAFDVVDEYILVEQDANRMRINISAMGSSGTTIYFTVYQFLDDFTTLAASSINTGTTSGASSTDYGIRISKDGYDVKTCTDEQCVLSSSFFTQIIHMKGVNTDGTSTVTINHDLGYIPSYLIFVKENSSDDYIRLYTLSKADDEDLIIDNNYEYDEIYYIIFKQKND